MNKKNRFRAGLSFGIGMAVFFILQDLLTNEIQTTKQLIVSVVAGLAAGALSGVLFGWIMGSFMGSFVKSKFVEQSTKIETDPDEKILFETGANHFKGMEGVGGKLYLTNKRLVFKSHKLNIQNHQLSITLANIKHVNRYKPLGMINNGLSVTTIDDNTENFVVEQAENWMKQLTQKNNSNYQTITIQGD